MIKIYDVEIIQGTFPDGTPLLRYEPVDEDYIIEWNYDSENELINIYYLVNHIRLNVTNPVIDLFMPYIPNARMDRVKSDNEIFTLKYFCDFINYMNFNNIMVKNAHSYVSLALLNNVSLDDIGLINDINYVESIIENIKVREKVMFPKSLLYFYPDEGAMKRYSEMFTKEYAFGMKKRDWETGKILGLDIIGDVKDKDILIIDDICSKGGTFYYSAKALKEAGAKNIYLYITHCEHSIYEGEIFKSGLINKVFTTDSIFRLDDKYEEENKKIEII